MTKQHVHSFSSHRSRAFSFSSPPNPLPARRLVAALSVMWMTLGGMEVALGETSATGSAKEGTSKLLSIEVQTRNETVTQLKRQYLSMSENLEFVLAEAIKKHKGDDRYMSPLHSAILTVETWRVFETEEALLSIVDYELDVGSLPLGINVSGDFFYPAACALVKLRVDPKKVVNAIAQTQDDRKRQLLTWVLRSRVYSVDEARSLLKTESANEGIQRAMEHLNQAVHVSDLLPRPKPSGKSNPGSPANAKSPESPK